MEIFRIHFDKNIGFFCPSVFCEYLPLKPQQSGFPCKTPIINRCSFTPTNFPIQSCVVGNYSIVVLDDGHGHDFACFACYFLWQCVLSSFVLSVQGLMTRAHVYVPPFVCFVTFVVVPNLIVRSL